MPQIILRRFLIKRINLLFRADHLYQAATSLMKNPLANSHHVPCYNPTRSIQFIKSKSGINQLVRPEKDKRLNVKTRCSESYRDRGKCLQTFKRVEVGFWTRRNNRINHQKRLLKMKKAAVVVKISFHL